MECWSFPPSYNNTYLPDSSSKFWFPYRETMDPGVRNEKILVRLREVMEYAYETSHFYKKKIIIQMYCHFLRL